MRRALALLLLPAALLAWWDFWPYTEHQDLTDKAVDIAAERWPELADEVRAYRGELKQGSHDEDFGEDTLYGSSADYSAYHPALPGAWWPTAQLPLNALQWVRAWQNPFSWDEAVRLYPTNRAAAWLALGHVLHNLQDLFVPAHAFIAPHGPGTSGLVENHSWPLYFDNFEQWCEVTANELDRADPARVPVGFAAVESLLAAAALFAATDQDSLGYRPSDWFAPPDAPGGWGRYRPYPYQGYPCGRDQVDNDLANAWSLFIVPRCVEYSAALIRLFYDQHHVAVREESHPPLRAETRPSVGRGRVRFSFELAARSRVQATVFDATGRAVRVLNDGPAGPGTVTLEWDGTDDSGRHLGPGAYCCHTRAAGRSGRFRAILTR